jgi:hypothetical protein
MDMTAQLCTYNPQTLRPGAPPAVPCQSGVSFAPSPPPSLAEEPPAAPAPVDSPRRAKVARTEPRDKENAAPPGPVLDRRDRREPAATEQTLGGAARFDDLVVGTLVSVWSRSKQNWVGGRVDKRDTSASHEASHFVDVLYVDNPLQHKVLLRDNVAHNLRLQAPAETSTLTELPREAAIEQDQQQLPEQQEEQENPYWMGLGPEGVRKAILPPAGFHLDRLTICNDFGPKNADDVKQVLAAYLPGKMADADRVQVVCLHGGTNPYTEDTWPADRTGMKGPACWNAPGGNFHCYQVSNWLYRQDGNRVTFHETTAERHNNPWGHVHPKLLLAVFKSDSSDVGSTMHWKQESDEGSAREYLRVSCLTHGPFGGGVCNGRCEYSAWYSSLFPISKFGQFTRSDFGVHLQDFVERLVEAADREHADNPAYYPPGQVHCQCEMGKYGVCKAEEDDGRPSCSSPVTELLRAVTHADCSAADAAGFRVVSSVIGHTEPDDKCQYAHVRVNTLASRFWGSNERKMPKTPKAGTPQKVVQEAPTYAELMTEEEKRSDLSLVIIVHNIAAGCTPRFMNNFQHSWKIADQKNVRVVWPAASCLVGDPDNPKIDHLIVPWCKGFDFTYRADTYSSSSRDPYTIKDKRHAVWQGDDHGGYNYLFKYEPHLLLPTPRRFGRWSGWKDDDPTVGPGLPLDVAQEGAPTSAKSDTQLRNAAPLLSDTVEGKRKTAELEKALWQAEAESSSNANGKEVPMTDWLRSGGKVTGATPEDASISAFSVADLRQWAKEAAVGQTLCVRGLDRGGRNRVRDIIRNNDGLSTVLTTEGIGFGVDRCLRITKQPCEERRYAHHFQQYIVLDGEQKPVAFLLTSANLSSFAWGDQCQCGEELPSFGLVPDRDRRGESDSYNAGTGSHDFFMRNFEFGILDLHPARRYGRAECSAQSKQSEELDRVQRPHALPVAVDLRNMKRFGAWEEPWCTRAHERLCQRVDERHMAALQQRLLDFAKPQNLGMIFPMDTGLTLTERSQVRQIAKEICDPDFDRDIPPWLRKDRLPCVLTSTSTIDRL